MRLPRKHLLEQRSVAASLSRWPRIIPSAHAATPAGAGHGTSRFSSPTAAFRVLYAAEDFATAFAEAVVRDRFEGKERRYLYRPYLETLMVTEIESGAPLRLLDLRRGGTYELGVDTDASRARSHGRGQAFAQVLHDGTTCDGILFDSRLTAASCVAVFERAFARLAGAAPVELLRVAALPAELLRLDIIVRGRRAI